MVAEGGRGNGQPRARIVKQEEAGGTGPSRRALIYGLAATATAWGVEARTSPQEEIRQAAQIISDKMQELHGGKWVTRIDHERRVVVIMAEV